MQHLTAGQGVWSEITPQITGKGRRRAAIAFVSDAAAGLLPLRRGDTLVANAGPAALQARATSPRALRAYVEGGVRVWSNPTLHAKVVVTPTKGFVGSANASHSAAARTIEAVMATDSARSLRQLNAFLDELLAHAQTQEVTAAFLEAATAIFEDAPRVRPIPGVSGRGPSASLVGESPTRMHIAGIRSEEWTEAETRAYDKSVRAARRKAGGWQTEAIPMPNDLVRSWRTGDLLLAVVDGVVCNAPGMILHTVGIPHTRRSMVYLRTDSQLPELDRPQVNRKLREAGYRGLGKARSVRSTDFIAAVLEIWGIDPAFKDKAGRE